MVLGAVIFDFDGTLIDSYTQRWIAHREVCKFLSEYLDKRGFEPDRDVILDLISKTEIKKSDGSEWNRDVWWREVLRSYFGKNVQIPSSTLSDATLIYWNIIMKTSHVYPGVSSLLLNLKKRGFLLGLISDTDGLQGMKAKRIAYSGLRGFFNAIIVAGEDTQEVKPSIKPFIKISELMSVPPEKCIFVGDNQKVDVLGAKALGIKTIIIENEINLFGNSVSAPDLLLKRENVSDLEGLIVEMLTVT